MDSYLESPALWPDVHNTIIGRMRELLALGLRPNDFCQVEDRVYMVDEDDPARSVMISDVALIEALGEHPSPAAESTSAIVAEPFPVANLIDDEIHEPLLQIIDAKSREVVTVIEGVSPSNKVPRSAGEASYRKERGDVLQSPADWVEIDLLRAGRRTRLKGRFRESDDRIHWSRVTERPEEWVPPVSLQQPLPKIPVPLRPQHAEAELEHQAVLHLAYDRAGYDLVLDDRSDPPPPPLTDEQRPRLAEILKPFRRQA
jgi:hypothetical protein